MRQRSLVPVALIAAVASELLLPARVARACSCLDFDMLAPADGQSNVPPNTKIWLVAHGYPTTTFTLAGPEGDVPVSDVRLGDAYYTQRFILTPARELTPGASYEVTMCDGQGPGLTNQCRKMTRFTVGTVRTEKPAVPVERGRSTYYREGERGSSCGSNSTRLVKFDLDWKGLLLLADIDGMNPYPADPKGVLFTAITDKRYAQYGFSLGKGPCVLRPWPDSDSARVRFGVVNLAGEFSGWGEFSTVTLPEDSGCQMAGGPGQRAPWTAGAVALLLLLMRRRRRGDVST